MEGLLVFLPVLGAPLLHAPVLRYDLLRWSKVPLDGGATWRGRRLLGDNKTLRGALVMILGVLLATLALEAAWPAWWDALPQDVRDASPALVGALVGAGIVLGELPNSFLKRRLDIAPGSQRRSAGGLWLTVLDQGDLVLGVWLALLPVYAMPVWLALLAFVVVSVVHLLINVVGYAIGARSSPI